MTPTIEPTPEQFARVAGSTDETPVVMLNLLRFKERADGIDAADGISGADAYARYAAGTAPLLAEAGGEVLYAGGAAAIVTLGWLPGRRQGSASSPCRSPRALAWAPT